MRFTRKIKIALAASLTAGLALGGALAANADITPIALLSQSQTSGHLAYSRTVSFTGAGLANISAVYLGSTKLADLKHSGDTKISFTVPHAPDFAPGTQKFSVIDNGVKIMPGRSFQYKDESSVDHELRYLGANLYKRGTSQYRYHTNEDCANFTSQVLHARGFAFTGSWYPEASNWVSSTRLRSYLLGTGNFVQYTDTQANRAKVNVGDVIQFDWDRSGDRDHSGIVTKITKNANGFIEIYYSAHTDKKANGYENSPSNDISIEQSEANHEKAGHFHKLGYAYFMHIR